MMTAEPFDFQVTRLSISDGVAILTLDNPKSSANVMDGQLQQELYARVAELEQQKSSITGLLVETAKPRIFIAGADIKHIAATGNYSHDQVIEFCEFGQRLYQRFAELPFPTVALIQGACVGGGLEFTLALDCRIAADEKATLIGLPEVHLGLIPGWAATVRVPRLCSIETGMQRIGTGENFSGQVALEIGMIDQLVAVEQLQSAGMRWIAETEPAQWQNRRVQLSRPATRLFEQRSSSDSPSDHSLEQGQIDELAAKVQHEINSSYPLLHSKAPRTVVDLIRRSALVDGNQAAQLEAEAMSTVYTSDSGQGLVNAFLLNDRAKKSPGLPAKPQNLRPIQTIGMVGLGLMGKSIVELLKDSDWAFLLFDQDAQRRSQAAEQFKASKNVTVVDALSDFSMVDVVLENIFERLEPKRVLLQQLEKVVAPTAHLLTNTSVIPIGEMQTALQNPTRFGGLHFFNPIAETRLAEIAKHEQMSDETQWAAHTIAKQARKMSIVVGDGPGLVVNRLLMALLNEAQHLLSEGYSIPEIDQAATKFGWRLGPFQILDVIGLQTAFDAGKQISKHLPVAVDAPPFLLPMTRAGYLGTSGSGFYQYGNQSRQWDPAVMKKIEHYVRPHKGPRCDSIEMAQRLCGAMIWQACEILERGQVESATDIDLCTVLALGFPAHRGGLLFWADRLPLARLAETFSRYRSDLQIPDSARRFLANNRRFYAATFPKRTS